MSQRNKPRLAFNNNTAGVRDRKDADRTREAGHLNEIQGVVANTLNLFRNGAVGFIDWLGRMCALGNLVNLLSPLRVIPPKIRIGCKHHL
jgi:hypothetical protein